MLDYVLGKELAAYVWPHKKLLFFSIVLSILATLIAVVPVYLIQPFLDEGMKSGSQMVTWKIPWIAFESGNLLSWHRTERVLIENITANHLIFVLAITGFLSVLCKSVADYFGKLSSAAFSNRAVRALRIDIFMKFVSLPLKFHQKRRTGELIGRATADVGRMQGVIVNILIGLIQHPLSAVVFTAYLLIMNLKLTLIVFCVAPLIIGVIRFFGGKLKKHAIRVQDSTADVTSAYQETLQCIKIVLGFHKEEFEIARFHILAQTLYKRMMRWCRWDLGMSPILDITVFIVLPATLLAGRMTFHHTLGELVSMLYAFSKVYGPVKKLAKVHNNIKTLQGATKRVFDIMNTVPEIQDRPGSKVLPRHKKAIEFNNVYFGYTRENSVLNGISFKVNAGEMVAFVGSTGAGKSTLVDLIPRFYDVTGGSITIDGMDIRDVSQASLRSQIGIVSQKTLLFNCSIKDNIAYGQTEKNMEKIESAARAANAHDFIIAQPNGYNTNIGDQGTMLSGGQRQRIAIARAILIEPSILILDEAASALDSESEKLVQRAIENLKGSRTIVAVAHRLSTIMKANCIHVLEGGKIVESGTLDDLLALKGRFKHLYDLQFSNSAEDVK